MKSVYEFLSDTLFNAGIEREFTRDMHVTTEELGLNSIELVNLSVALYDEYGVKLKLLKHDNLSLFELCNEVSEKMTEQVEVPVIDLSSSVLEEPVLEESVLLSI